MKTLARSKTIAAHKLRQVRDRLFAPKPIVSGTEYADDQCYLIEGGKLRKWTTYDFQREILDAFIDVTIGEVVVMKSARMGISECINHAVQYWLDHEPCDVLMYRPKDEDAEGYLTNRFDKRVEMVPAMQKIAFRTSTGKAVKKSTERKFKNGASLLVLGAAAEDNFRDHTKKKIILDEFDALNFGPVKGGGSKYDMARRRGSQYWDRKVIAISTPKAPAENGGRIHGLFLKSDQRHLYVQCPHCGEEFTPRWGDKETTGGIKWEPDDHDDVWYECHRETDDRDDKCPPIREHHKREMTRNGRWVPHNPGHSRRGYYLWQWFSRSPNGTWQHMVKEWHEALAAGPAQVQSFKNEVLGLPYSKNTGQETADFETLANCVTDLGEGVEVPGWAVSLLMSVDRQRGNADESESYLEASLYAIGPGRRLFMVAHWILDEFPQTDKRAWDALEALATRTYIDEQGRPRKVDGLAIDHNGGGSQRVVDWLKKMRGNPGQTAARGRRHWVAVRGESKGNGARGKTIWPTTTAKRHEFLFTIDVDLAKDDLAPILADGAIEFSARPIEGSVDLSDDVQRERFLKRLLLEKQYPVENRAGATVWKSPKGKGRDGNEPFDNVVYTWALSHGMTQMAGGMRWRKLFSGEQRFRAKPTPAPTPEGEYDPETGEVYDDKPEPATEAPKAAAVKVPKNPFARAAAGNAPLSQSGKPMVRVRTW
ncbi:terminase gpA endonuclease subunit [Sagittula sp. MA-2]|jgi:phage terminase large subunit GpA-like protein|uniref:terminase gpA endonuclease subunit n=1 Tax=Sagittula sp. MA-2 TaxID=3048007 RepID=UPI0024C3D9B4|nr:terminase gpA endonuclease subunit [Sagittula sp. MA-2]WHZ36500.1 phage terminase large subunit family protein [Sagittula sp. MA-2]